MRHPCGDRRRHPRGLTRTVSGRSGHGAGSAKPLSINYRAAGGVEIETDGGVRDGARQVEATSVLEPAARFGVIRRNGASTSGVRPRLADEDGRRTTAFAPNKPRLIPAYPDVTCACFYRPVSAPLWAKNPARFGPTSQPAAGTGTWP